MSKWTHPIHARGIRSPKLDFGHVGEVLTDKQIDEYARQGRYGEDAQKAALARVKKKRKPQQNLLKQALKLLGL